MKKDLSHYVCTDPLVLAWERVREEFDYLREKSSGAVAAECEAAIGMIKRRLKCMESDACAFNAIRVAYWKILASGQTVDDLGASLEELHRVSPELDSIKSSCGDLGVFENSSELYRSLLVIKTKTVYLSHLAGLDSSSNTAVGEIHEIIDKTPSHLSSDVMELFKNLSLELSKAVSGLTHRVTETEDALGSCDAEEIRDSFENLEAGAVQVSYAYGTLMCELGQHNSLAQPVFYSALRDRLERFGLIAAEVFSAAGRVCLREKSIGKELTVVWEAMRTKVAGQLQRAFQRLQERQLCPPALCYEGATLALRQAIERGLADAKKWTVDTACTERRLVAHGQLVYQVTDEIEKIFCKAKHVEHFEHCVLIELGAYAMRLQTVLRRTTTDVADSVRTVIEDWEETAKWFSDIKSDPTTEPAPRVTRQLRTILGIYRWLEGKARGLSSCAACEVQAGGTIGGRETPMYKMPGPTVDPAAVMAGWSNTQQLLELAKAQNLLPKNQIQELSDSIQKEVSGPIATDGLAVAGDNLRLARLRGLFTVYLAKAQDDAARKCVCVRSSQQNQLNTLQQQLGKLMQSIGGGTA